MAFQQQKIKITMETYRRVGLTFCIISLLEITWVILPMTLRSLAALLIESLWVIISQVVLHLCFHWVNFFRCLKKPLQLQNFGSIISFLVYLSMLSQLCMFYSAEWNDCVLRMWQEAPLIDFNALFIYFSPGCEKAT